MYLLRDSACSPYVLDEKEYNFLIGQLRARRTSDLKQQMQIFIDAFGIAALRELIKTVEKEYKGEN